MKTNKRVFENVGEKSNKTTPIGETNCLGKENEMPKIEIQLRKEFDQKLKADLAHWFEIKVNGAPAGEEIRTSFQARDFADVVFDYMVEEIDMDEDDFDHDGDPMNKGEDDWQNEGNYDENGGQR